MHRKVAAIQMTSGMDLDENIAMAKELLQRAADQGAVLALLPEMFPLLGKGEIFQKAKQTIQEQNGSGKIQAFLSHEAQRLSLWIVGGTIPLRSGDPHKSYASCLVFNAQGEIVAHYDKMHLFDVNISQTEYYRESDTTVPGEKIVVVDTPVGRVGLSVCFDIRFPELYSEMVKQGAQVLMVPSAFTVPTGQAHWEVLLRARAIENFCYVVAAAQWGVHGQGRATFGDSMIVDPTGHIMDRLQSGIGVLMADIDLALVDAERKKMPLKRHSKIAG